MPSKEKPEKSSSDALDLALLKQRIERSLGHYYIYLNKTKPRKRKQKRKEESNMKIITINLPEKYIDAIKELTQMGKYSNRSKAIRIALKDFLTEELQTYQDLDDPELYEMLAGEVSN
jgi:Arc/MetJ-type ribon-helix-helix transcriptional regulator